MSNPYRRRLSLTALDTDAMSAGELRALVARLLAGRLHGLCFSPYLADQGPGTILGEAQVRERLAVVAPHTQWVRSFSCREGNEHIPQLAREAGLRTLVGAWLDDDLDNNEAELDAAIALARDGVVDILAVGNEVLLRGDLDESALIDYLQRAKAALPGVPVGYVDAYFQFGDHPAVTSACDVVLANCYPFWEGCPIEFAPLYMRDMYRQASRAAGDKTVIVSEAGWPDAGSPEGAAVPSHDNALRFFVETCRWMEEDGIELFWFAAFDEDWKTDREGDVGGNWGLWDSSGRAKFW